MEQVCSVRFRLNRGTKVVNINKHIKLGVSLSLLTTFLMPCQAVFAYSVVLKAQGDVTLTTKLEEYEKTALRKIADAIDSYELDSNTGFSLTFSNTGQIEKVKFLAPRPAKSIQTQIEEKLSAIEFGTIPGLSDGSTLNIEVDLQELKNKTLKRQRFSTFGGRSTIVAGNITIGGSSISQFDQSEKQGKKAPYTKSDKQFEKEINDLYIECDVPMELNNKYSLKKKNVKSSKLLELAEIKEDAKQFYQASILYSFLADSYAEAGNFKEAKTSFEKGSITDYKTKEKSNYSFRKCHYFHDLFKPKTLSTRIYKAFPRLHSRNNCQTEPTRSFLEISCFGSY